jgi:type VI secretion system secreted protein VgrG
MAVFRSADEESFLFKAGKRQMRVVDFSAREEISTPFEVDLTLATRDDEEEVTFDDVVGEVGLLTIFGLTTDSERHFHGIVSRFWQTGSTGRFFLYKATLVPSLWLLSLAQDCRIFQEKEVKEIIEDVLTDAGITSDRFEFRLQGSYDKTDYCVQYRETDLNFISRLAEAEGIFYFFEHEEDSHLLVFADSAGLYQPIQGDKNDDNQVEIAFRTGTGMVVTQETIQTVAQSRQVSPGKVSLKDFNFLKPSAKLLRHKEAKTHAEIEQYDYPGDYIEDGRGDSLANIRLDEGRTFLEVIEGQSNCPRLIPGFTFKLTEHDLSSFEKDYLLTGVSHFGSQPQVLEEQAGTEGFSYSNQFSGIPSDVVYRPLRKTPKPIVQGIQTAIVVGPAGEEIYTDEHGRVKVQFHWDRVGEKDEKSSCWIRVSQIWAGAGWGAMHIPRIDQEVVVDFLEGDPDKPLITGRIYHGTNTPPYKLPDEKTKSTLRSQTTPGGGSHNELLMEDKSKETQVVLLNAYGHKLTMDEKEQILTIETRDQHKVSMDDKNKLIAVETTNAHKLLFDDENKKIVLSSTNGHTLEIDDENKKITTLTTDGHKLLFDDENKKIELVTTDGHSAVLDDDQKKLSLASSSGHQVTLDDDADNVTIEDAGGNIVKLDAGSTITLESGGDITISGEKGAISIKGMDISIEATNELNLKGGKNLNAEAGVQYNAKGTMVKTESSGPHTIKGTPVQIN